MKKLAGFFLSLLVLSAFAQVETEQQQLNRLFKALASAKQNPELEVADSETSNIYREELKAMYRKQMTQDENRIAELVPYSMTGSKAIMSMVSFAILKQQVRKKASETPQPQQ